MQMLGREERCSVIGECTCWLVESSSARYGEVRQDWQNICARRNPGGGAPAPAAAPATAPAPRCPGAVASLAAPLPAVLRRRGLRRSPASPRINSLAARRRPATRRCPASVPIFLMALIKPFIAAGPSCGPTAHRPPPSSNQQPAAACLPEEEDPPDVAGALALLISQLTRRQRAPHRTPTHSFRAGSLLKAVATYKAKEAGEEEEEAARTRRRLPTGDRGGAGVSASGDAFADVAGPASQGSAVRGPPSPVHVAGAARRGAARPHTADPSAF
ncbi:translation initiation factor IF-2-like [Schistocerca nitens]|uniref:translation initiation factor IF-2-like n=1 Tax=Schistocerca nitens TaxID=7011 RepID=UPI002117F9FE|nr:translation initiation factor IF-2-like [Schistocerca nitens]